MELSCPAPATFLFFNQKTGNRHKIVCQNGSPYEKLEILTTFSKTAFHTAAAKKNRDTSFNTSAESLSIFEFWTFLISLLGWLPLAATLWNTNKLNTCFLALLNVTGTEKSSIGTINSRGVTEGFLMTFKGKCHMGFIRRIAIEHTILGDQASGTFSNKDFVTEFYRLQDFTSLDQIGMGFKNGKELLFVRNLFSVDHPPPVSVNSCVNRPAGASPIMCMLGSVRLHSR